jgi:hypothetical protein
MIHYLTSFFIFSLWEYWLGKTKRFVANSTWEAIFWVLKRLYRQWKGIKDENSSLSPERSNHNH